MNAAGHISVLREEVVAALAPRPAGVYCDATVGLGGHAAALLSASGPDGRLVGIDRDPHALRIAAERLAPFGDRVLLLRGRFGQLPALLSEAAQRPGWERLARGLDGLLADLGVSSLQLDEAARGFGFRQAAPLDMRMDPEEGPSAADWLAAASEAELVQVLRDYGEVPGPKRVARAVRAYLEATPEPDTVGLADAIARAMPRNARRRAVHPATQAFMAIRIAVNRELQELDALLSAVPAVLAPGGRAAVITFHSLEDRRVKRRFAALSRAGADLPPGVPLTEAERGAAPCALPFHRPITPTAREVARNPRARSARLRVLERRDSGPQGEPGPKSLGAAAGGGETRGRLR